MSKPFGTLLMSLVGLTVAAAAGASVLPCAAAACVLAPEIDPASAASALTLLAGSLMVLRGRRLKK